MSEDIIIDLSQTQTLVFEDKNFIQKDAKNVFSTLAKDFITKSKNKSQSKSEDELDRTHNTILINGKRGSGKTSFALHVKNKLDLNICALKIIDPTLIESKEHVLLNVITLIKEKVEKYIKCDKCDINDSKYKSWKESLKDLAGGLCMLDGVGSNHLNNDLWDSPELILEQGLSNSKHGHKLEKNLHKYIDESLKILDKDAFLLTLDDIDTSVDKGVAILEVLRKYLTSPKLIIVLLGDIELYSTLVRQLQWQKIDPNKILLDYEFCNCDESERNRAKYTEQIEHLEEQYLVKILKPENRIHLKMIYDLMGEISIVGLDLKETRLKDYSNEMIKTLFLSAQYIDLFEKTLYTQPTRSIIQILKAYEQNEKKLQIGFVEKFHDTFYTTLQKHLQKAQLLDPVRHDNLMNTLGVYILKNSDIDRDANLEILPEYIETDKNIAMFYLNLLFNNYVSQKDYLSYFIKIGYALEQYDFAAKDAKDDDKFINHIGLNRNESNSIVAQKILSTFDLNSNTAKKGYIKFGNIFIPEFNKNKISKDQNVTLIASKIYNPKGGSYHLLSFFKLLGILADIAGKDENEVLRILRANETIHEFRIFQADEKVFSDETIDNDSQQVYKEANPLYDDLITWAKKSNNIAPLPIFVLAKIWKNFVYAIQNIEGRNKGRSEFEIFNLYIIGFINAVFVQIELYYGRYIDIRNINISDKPYKDKSLKRVKDDGEELYTLTEFIVECPLFEKYDKYFAYLKSSDNGQTKDEGNSDERDFKNLSDEEKMKVIRQIKGWETYATSTICNYLRYEIKPYYVNVSWDYINNTILPAMRKSDTSKQ